MSGSIKPHQLEAAQWLSGKETALLADAPRVGKTLSAIHACDLIDARRVIVACPPHLRENWCREIEEWREGRWGAWVVGYSTVKDFNVKFREHEADVLINDESHYLKTRDSQRSVAVWGKNSDRVGGLTSRVKRIWNLSGTPMTKSPLDLWPALRACAPELITRPLSDRPLSYSAFSDKYCSKIMTPFGLKIVGSKNAKELRHRIAPWIMRRTRAEVFGTDIQPPTLHHVKPGGSVKEIVAFEESATGKAIRKAVEKGDMKTLAKLAEHASEYRRLLGLSKVSGVSDYVRDRLDEEDGSKVIVACWHTAVIDAYRESLKDLGVVVLDGRVPGDRKQALVDRFQKDPKVRVFIGQIVAAGTGITLSAADEVVFGEISWVGTDNEQMGARPYAPGKDSPCLQTYAVVAGTLDDEIARVASRRENDAKKVLEGKHA